MSQSSHVHGPMLRTKLAANCAPCSDNRELKLPLDFAFAFYHEVVTLAEHTGSRYRSPGVVKGPRPTQLSSLLIMWPETRHLTMHQVGQTIDSASLTNSNRLCPRILAKLIRTPSVADLQPANGSYRKTNSAYQQPLCAAQISSSFFGLCVASSSLPLSLSHHIASCSSI